jgi:flagellin-like hook-associated protein FlgL
MTNDVALTAALRTNLISLQQTQSEINTHEARLATGKKVNSALDSPLAYYASQNLTNQANQLSTLLDSIGQSIQTINAANSGTEALTSLVTQNQAIAQSALTTINGTSTNATITGNTNLQATGSNQKLTSITGINSNDNLTFTVQNPTTGVQALVNSSVTIGASTTANDLVSAINDLNTGLSSPVITASLNSSGNLVISSTNGGLLNVQFKGGVASDATNEASAGALGFAGTYSLNNNGAATANTVDVTSSPNATIFSKGLYTGLNALATSSTVLSALKDVNNNALTTLAAADTLTITVGGKTASTADFLHNTALVAGVTAATTTVQNLVDGINNDSTLKTLVSASFNAGTGQIVFSPLTASASDIKLSLGGAAGQAFSLGFGTSPLTTAVAAAHATEDIRFGAAAGTLASLQSQYNTGLAQINSLVQDTGYNGVNLLAGQNLTTNFNPQQTGSLTTVGSNLNATGLGLTAANFSSTGAIQTSITATQTALTTIQNFGSTLSENLAIIQNQQTFINATINTLKTGSDNLVNADQNEEGATLLALQTRQALGTTALSLASQSQQSILKLFP